VARSFAFKSILLGSLIVFVQSASAFACKCPPKTLAENISRADSIFLGQVSEVTEAKPWNDFVRFQVSFQVSRTWKGKQSATLTVIDGPACHTRFKKGGSYLVFAHAVGNELTTNACAGTRSSTQSPELVKQVEASLGK
jgi:hypothetical protein